MYPLENFEQKLKRLKRFKDVYRLRSFVLSKDILEMLYDKVFSIHTFNIF